MKEMESVPPDIKSRRRWLAGIGFLSLFPLFKSGIFSRKKQAISCLPPADKKETIKLLSQDGRLVEVDVSRINQIRKKISDEELKTWIKKK